jgi:hypothetical protein
VPEGHNQVTVRVEFRALLPLLALRRAPSRARILVREKCWPISRKVTGLLSVIAWLLTKVGMAYSQTALVRMEVPGMCCPPNRVSQAASQACFRFRQTVQSLLTNSTPV